MIRFSQLKTIARSPAHYQYALTHPTDPTPAMRIGTLTHGMVLGGPQPVVYEGERRGNAWKEFKAAHEGVEIVTVAEHDQARAIADAVLADRRVTELLEGTTKETRADRVMHGLHVCGTPDAFSDTIVLDLKTTADARPDAFAWQCRKMHYAVQVVFYGDLLGGRDRHLIVGVEAKGPHPVTILELTPEMVDRARRTYIGWIEQLQNCTLSGVWPGYSEAVLPLDAIESLELDFEEAAE